MKIKVLYDFFDKTAHLALRKAGERLEVPAQRAHQLISMNLAEQITELKKETK